LPNIKSAKKRVRIEKKKNLRNRMYLSMLRTAVKKAKDKSAEDRVGSVRVALRLLDKSVTKGVLHRNTAARRKSALVRQLLMRSKVCPVVV
jgi:small subunit ribosomal protein S20